MNQVKDISIEAYDYPLPDERIAKYPLAERDASKLLVLKDNKISKSQFKHIGDYLPKEAFNIEVYTEAYIRFDQDHTIYSDEYEEYMDGREKQWKSLTDSRAKLQSDKIYEEAKQKLNDGKAEFEEKRNEGKQQLDEAKQKITKFLC